MISCCWRLRLPALLRQLARRSWSGTYQAGKLVMVRDEGDHLNTHYRTFQGRMKCAESAFACCE
jgi:hypothetical protein